MWATSTSLASTSLFASDVDSLMSQTIQRARAVRSGRIEYQFQSGTPGQNEGSVRLPPPTQLLFAGTRWLQRTHDKPAVQFGYGDDILKYSELLQPGGNVLRTAVLSRLKQPMEQRRENRRPTFAGTFWHTQQLEYVESHRGSFRLAPSATIDGIDCEVCEVDVPAEDTPRAFHPQRISRNARGVLRLYIAAKLGFVMPLIEGRAEDGKTLVSYQSQDFVEFPGNLYFPRRTRMELSSPSGAGIYEQFTITPEQINDPISQSEFAIEIPVGTHVRDERDETNIRRFVVTDATNSFQLAGIDGSSQTGDFEKRGLSSRILTYTVASMVVIALVGLAMAALLWRRRPTR
jgi:hypothetical protein